MSEKIDLICTCGEQLFIEYDHETKCHYVECESCDYEESNGSIIDLEKKILIKYAESLTEDWGCEN